MTGEQWDALVRRIEPLARQNPGRYAFRVGLLAALGYAYIALTLLVLVALGVAVVVVAFEGTALLIKLIIPVGALALIILRSLWVRIEPPEGIPVGKKDAPELFGMLDDVRSAVDGPRVHKVLVDGDLNAGIVQVPRLGPLGWQRNYLVLGLPLMEALSPGEFRAVVAHEMGHLSKRHGRFGTWVYRVRATWYQLLTNLEERRHWGSALFRRFFEWYVPYFNAYSFALMRTHEFEADKAAADAAGAGNAGAALAQLRFAGRVLETEYWPKLYQGTLTEQEPPEAAYAPMAQLLPAVRTRNETERWLTEELELAAETTDTHPSLTERLEALGVDPSEILESREEATVSAAEEYLGPWREELVGKVDRGWREAVRPAWQEQWAEAEKGRLRLQDLDGRNGNLTLDELKERASLTAQLESSESALPLYQQVLASQPDDAPSQFAVGQILLDRDNEQGLAYLDRAMEIDADAIFPACEVAYGFLHEHGREEEASRYRERAERHVELLGEAQEERQDISVDDELEPHDLPDEVVDRIRSVVAQQEEIAEAYLVRKRVEHLRDEYPLYVIGIIPRKRWRQLWKDEDADKDGGATLAERVAEGLDLPVDFHVIVPGPRSGMDKRLEQVERAKIFGR
jgi:Zn-dependent protease with chaperone function